MQLEKLQAVGAEWAPVVHWFPQRKLLVKSIVINTNQKYVIKI